MKKILIAALALTVLSVSKVQGQAKERAETIAAEFNKTKHKEKVKNGVKTETHTTIEAKADVREDVSSYAAKYEMGGFGHYIVLRQANNKWEGEYFKTEDGKAVKLATLTDIKIESALLTATINHSDGRSASFEGAFVNRFEHGEKISGLGIRHLLELSNGFVADKAFFKREE